MNESPRTRHSDIIISLQKEVERSKVQIEKLIADSTSLSQNIADHDTRLRKLETSHTCSNNSGAWEGASSVTELVETSRRVNSLDAKIADIEILMTESNRTLEELKSRVAFLTRRLETSQETVLRLEQRVESQVRKMKENM